MEHNKSKDKVEDGWDNFSNQSEESVQLISLYRHDNGRPILEQQYSLEPDMATGWLPKLPSCPIPLTYKNNLVESVLQKIESDPRYKVIYRGPRHINSVQLHKNNSYFWKYRQKYDVKINAISEAIQTIGREGSDYQRLCSNDRSVEQQNQISFDSDFQSGNLDLVVRVKPSEFDCFIRSDTNTRGHTNWYYFKVNNKKNKGTIQFNLCNLSKHKNLYNRGMKPYSLTKTKNIPYNINNEWTQDECYDVQFVQRLCRYDTNNIQNQLQFKYNFKEENMEVQFAYSIPYTFSHLQSYIEQIQNHHNVKISHLCESFSGLDLPLINVCHQSSYAKNNIVILGRIHPGQTNSSHVLEGFINSLLEKNSIAHRLLSSLNFYIIPMINPDGVVAGNYRTSFSGRDLNRSFNSIGNFKYPELSGLTDLFKKLKSQRKKVEFFFDFHSHSSKKNLFCYGPEHVEGTLYYFRSKILVKILQKQSSMFNQNQCNFKISEYKKGTARAYMLNKQKIPMSFTFQISNGLYSISNQSQAKFDQRSLQYGGRVIANGLAQYCHNYHRQVAKQPNMKVLKFKDDRLSFSINQKSFFKLKKSHNNSKSVDSSQLNSTINQNSIKNMMNQILEEKQFNYVEHQAQSDSQASEHDLQDQQINTIFSSNSYWSLKSNNNHVKSLQTPSELGHQKVSLKKIKSKIQLLRPSISTMQFRDENRANSTQKNLTKQRKSRIYYEQTHPKTPKRVFQNIFQTKKPLKQKRFPILF